jgi:hypothetical protein
MRRLGYVLSATLLLLSCHNPLHETDPDLATLRVRAAADSDVARTVVPDFTSQIDELTVSLTSVDGYASPAPQTATSAPWQVNFSVQPGNWNITVVAKKAGVQVGEGSLSNVTLKGGLTDPVTVPITFGGSGTGGVRFAVSFPGSLGIDYVHGRIEGTTKELVPALMSSGGRKEGVFAFSGLSGGTSTLVLTFKRGGATGTVAGIFREKLIVTPGFQSGSWVGPDGSLLAERAFAESEFYSAEASLAGLSINNGVFAASSFTPSTLTYDLGSLASLPSPVAFTATGSIGGQYLEYSWNGGTFTNIRSGTASTALIASTVTNTLEVRVTAPDRATKNVYRVTFSGSITEGGTYSLPATGGSINVVILADGTVTVSGSTSGITSVAIPSSIGEHKVTSISADAFRYRTTLSAVTIPDSVTTIGSYAFDSTSLTSITIPDSVISIGTDVFTMCSQLKTVTLSAKLKTISHGAFYHCTGLTSVTIPKAVTSIDSQAFDGCSSLISLHVQAESPPTLGENALNNNASGRRIYVTATPTTVEESYKTDAKWSAYATSIFKEP